jgi:hypothetical protein
MNKHSLLILTAFIFSIFFTLMFQIEVKAEVKPYTLQYIVIGHIDRSTGQWI